MIAIPYHQKCDELIRQIKLPTAGTMQPHDELDPNQLYERMLDAIANPGNYVAMESIGDMRDRAKEALAAFADALFGTRSGAAK